MAWRYLSNEQGDAFCSGLPKDPKDLRAVSITSSSQDAEAFRYAQDFDEALRPCIVSAGLTLSDAGGLGNSFWGQKLVHGVWVRFQNHFTLDDPKSPELILNPRKRRALPQSVRTALEAHGVRVEGISDQGRGLLDIYVRPKFPPHVESPNKEQQTDTTKTNSH